MGYVILDIFNCYAAGGSVGIISIAREDWTPSVQSSGNIEDDEMSRISIRIKGQKNDDSLDVHQQSQADWIRQYVAQQDEVLNVLEYICILQSLQGKNISGGFYLS